MGSASRVTRGIASSLGRFRSQLKDMFGELRIEQRRDPDVVVVLVIALLAVASRWD